MHRDRGAIALRTVALLGGVAGLYHDGFLFGCGAALLAASIVNCIYQREDAITGCGAVLLWLLFLPLLDWGAAALYLGGGLGGALLARHTSYSALLGCFYGTFSTLWPLQQNSRENRGTDPGAGDCASGGSNRGRHLPLLLSSLSGMFAGALLGCMSAKLMPRFLLEFKSRQDTP